MRSKVFLVTMVGLLLASCGATEQDASIAPAASETVTTSSTTTSTSTTTVSGAVPATTQACLDPGGWKFESFTNTHDIADIGSDGSGGLWIATWGAAIHLSGADGRLTRYASEDGPASDGLTSVGVAADGTVWFGTFDSGVSRLANGEWTSFSTPDLPHRQVNSISVREDEVWVATAAGLAHFDGAVWTQLTEIQGRPLGYVTSVAVGPDGRVWLFEGGGEGEEYRPGYIAVLNGGAWQIAGEVQPFAGHLSAFDGTGNLWFADPFYSEPRLTMFDGLHTRPLSADDGLPNSSIRALATDNSGTIWVGTQAGIARLVGDTWNIEPDLDWVAQMNPVALDWSGDTLWIAVSEGRIFRYAPDGTDEWTLPTDLPAHPTDVAVTDLGVVWVSTDPGGVVRIDESGVTQFNRDDGVADDRLWAVAATDDEVWVGTAGVYGVSSYDGSTWATYNDFGDSDIKDISIAPDGDVWIATGHTLHQVTNGAWTTRLNTAIQGNSWYVESVDAGLDGQVWVSGPDGPAVYEAGEWHQFSAKNSPDGPGNTHLIAVAPDGTVWTGGEQLARFQGGSWELVDHPDLAAYGVFALAVSRDGDPWVGTGDGISVLSDGSWTHITAADGLTSNQVLAIDFDTQGTAWIVTGAGLAKVSPACH